MPAKCKPRACAMYSAMKANTAPTAAGAMQYHSMLTHVLTCATSFHQWYSMMKLVAVWSTQPTNANATNTTMKTRICEGRIKAIFAHPAVAPLGGQTALLFMQIVEIVSQGVSLTADG